MNYRCIVTDPPWPEQGAGKIKRGADRHYPLIKTKEEILCVMLQAQWDRELAVFDPDLEGCHLWIWTTNNYLPWALWLMEALGFRYKTVFTWVKACQVDEDMSSGAPWYGLERPGLGQYSMGQTEQLLFGTKGKAMKPSSKDRPRTALMAPRPAEDGKVIHSAKPPEAQRMIELVSPGPRLEMFAREQKEGWDCWGEEV